MSGKDQVNLDYAPAARSLHSAKLRTFLTLFDQGVVSIATYVTGVMVSWSSQSGFGLYILVFTLWVFGTEIHNSLVSTPQMLKLPTLKGRRVQSFNGSVLLHQLALSAVLTALLLLSAAILFAVSEATHDKYGTWSFTQVALMGAISIGPMALRNFARNFCFAIRDVPSAVMLDIGVSILQLVGVGLAYFTHELGHHWYLAVIVVAGANLISAMLWLSTARKAFVPRLRRAVVDFRRTWIESRFIFLSSMVWTAGIYLYPWLIVFVAGEKASGIWAACFYLANLGNPLIMGIQNMMGPAISNAFVERDPGAFRSFVFKCMAVFASVGAAGSLVLALLAERLLVMFNGTEYAGFGGVTAILTLTMLLQAMSFPTSRALFSLDRAKLDMYANVGPLLVMMVAGVFLIQRYGVMGAGICLVVAQLIGSLARVIFFLRASAANSGERAGASGQQKAVS